MRPMPWIVGSTTLGLGLLAFQVLATHPARPLPQGHFYTGSYGEPPASLNPFITSERVARGYVLRYTHDALMDWDPQTGLLRPALAESVEPMEDGVTFLFTLRDGLRFSDGSPMTLEDVMFTWEVCSDDSVPLGSMGPELSRVSKVEALPGPPDRLRVTLKEPFPAGFESFATEWTVVQKRYVLEEVARVAEQMGRSVPAGPGEDGFGQLLAAVKLPGPGTGPYQLEQGFDDGELSWPPTRELLLVQSPESWRREVYQEAWNLAGFRLLFLTDTAAVISELLNGSLDWYNAPDPEALFEQYPELRDQYTLHAYDYRNLGHFWIVWNLQREALQDVRVRQALSRMFDRAGIVNELLGGNGTPAYSFFKPGTPYYPEDSAPVPFDTKRAGELLREAGYRPDQPLRIRVAASQAASGFYRRVLSLLDSANRQVPELDLDLQFVDWAAQVEMRGRHDFDGLFYQLNHGASVDPYPNFHSSHIGEYGQNDSGYKNDEVDRILEEARREWNPDRRAELYQRFNEILMAEQPVTFLAHPRASMLINKNIRGVKPGPLGLIPERWWVPVELQRR